MRYGRDSSYGTATLPILVGNGRTHILVNHTSDDLLPSATYYYLVVATNALGAVFSRAQRLTVPALFAPGDKNDDGVVDRAELDSVLVNYWLDSPWLQTTNAAGLGGTHVTFSLTNSVADAFSIEFTTNFADWHYLGPATPRYGFTDTNAPALPQRFYRLGLP